jgi:hypothetical protein
MITHVRSASAPALRWTHQHDFEYRNTPRAGLNWPFVRKMILGVIVWSPAVVSALFWGCLLVAAVR